jgi:hypothetical protein
MSVTRWYNKANAFANGWKSQYTEDPPKSAVILGLAVAQLETHCGDVWPGAHNWGAVQLRTLTRGEAEVLQDAELFPQPSNTAAGQAALQEAIEACKIPLIRNGSLQVDSSPRLKTKENPRGYYWVFFQSFSDDTAAAERFVHVLSYDRPACHQVLISPAGSEQELAAAMRASGYYEGTHDNKTAEGRQQNIDAYASALRGITPDIRKALVDWTPGAAPPPETFDLTRTDGIQEALNKLGQNPKLRVDGVLGPFTKQAIENFQVTQGLSVDGVAGPATQDCLRRALRLIGF